MKLARFFEILTTAGTCWLREPPAPKQWIAVAWNSKGQHHIIRNNPSDEDVQQFARIQRYRYHNDLPGGPGGHPADYIESADIWADEVRFKLDLGRPMRSVDLDMIPTNPGTPGE